MQWPSIKPFCKYVRMQSWVGSRSFYRAWCKCLFLLSPSQPFGAVIFCLARRKTPGLVAVHSGFSTLPSSNICFYVMFFSIMFSQERKLKPHRLYWFFVSKPLRRCTGEPLRLWSDTRSWWLFSLCCIFTVKLNLSFCVWLQALNFTFWQFYSWPS